MKVMVVSAMSKPASTTHTLASLAAEACGRHADVTVDFVTPQTLGFPVNDGTVQWDLPEYEAWRVRIGETDAHIWVSPEYHGALAASLKNLFDYLPKEPMPGHVVGLCALAGGAVAALNTLNGMAVIARSLGAWAVPTTCAFTSKEVGDGLDERALGRLAKMCDTVIETARRLRGPLPGGAESGLAATVASLDRAANEEPPPPPPAPSAPEATGEPVIPGLSDEVEVAKGISGTRYRATRKGTSVLVRVVPAALLDGDARERFERDQEQVRALPPHPYLAAVLDTGIGTGGDGYVISEGTTSVAEWVRDRGPMPWRDAVAAAVRLAGALETVHRSGLLHRDLGPVNVLFDGEQPALADIAVAPLGVRSLEYQRQVALAHLAPELFRGEDPSPASDMYGLGSTLFAMVVGRPAFTDDADRKVVALIRRIAVEPVPDLRSQLPEPVCLVIERAMAKAPGERFATAEELGRSLQQAQMLSQLPTATMTFFASGSEHSPVAAP